MYQLFLLSSELRNTADYQKAISLDKSLVITHTKFSKQEEWIKTILNWSENFPLSYTVLEVNGSPQTSSFGSLGNQLQIIRTVCDQLCLKSANK